MKIHQLAKRRTPEMVVVVVVVVVRYGLVYRMIIISCRLADVD